MGNRKAWVVYHWIFYFDVFTWVHKVQLDMHYHSFVSPTLAPEALSRHCVNLSGLRCIR